MKEQFLAFWHLYAPLPEHHNRYLACERLWGTRDERTRRLILRQLEQERQRLGEIVVHKKNPYFFLIDWHPLPPTNYNGKVLPAEPVATALWNGKWGVFTLTDIELYGLETKPA